MGPWIRAAAIALLLAGCATGSPVAPPEVKSMLDFGAYPGGTLLEEHINDSGPTMPWTTGYGTRVYTTSDAPATVRAHYETLAKTHGWTVEGPSPPPGGATTTADFVMLRYKRFLLSVNTFQGDPYQPTPASPEPNARTRVTVSASTSAQ